ncbi:MAG: HipA domain-containing protein [Deltaproteobacteria bacterium]|nr:HipA domain-containing protein [Deltaproteobacteria bacterium]
MKCLKCCQPVDSGDFHTSCALEIFGQKVTPHLATTEDELETFAKDLVSRRIAVTGVQRKLSLELSRSTPDRFTIVGALGGNYILKPPSHEYPALPENEHLTMTLAGAFGIKTATHSLIRMADGKLAYLTKRFDRANHQKIAVEDLCQLSEVMTEQKYRSSHERVAKQIKKYSTIPGDDLLRYFELTLFCFLTGNADMHLKNFAMMQDQDDFVLTPAYDLLSTRLILEESIDPEELALSLNGKKSKLTRHDFLRFAENIGILDRVAVSVIARFSDSLDQAQDLIRLSFLPPKLQGQFAGILQERMSRMVLG